VKKYTFLTASLVIGLMVVGAGSSFAQTSNSASAAASAEVLTALTISSHVDLSFGKIAADPAGSTGGTVTVAAVDGAREFSGPLMMVTSTPTAAKFTVSGDSNYAFTVTNQSGTSITVASGEDTMTVDTWTLSPASGWTLDGGTLDVFVGATLHVGATQAKGTYSNATGVRLTVAYN
jgi:hypothetical protein